MPLASALPFVLSPSTTELPYGGPGSQGPDRDWDLLALHLDLDLQPEQGRVEGSVTLRFSRITPQPGPIVLDQVGLSISEVTSAEGLPMQWEQVGDHLVIQPVLNMEGQSVKVHYSAEPHTGLHFRRPGPDSPDSALHLFSQGEGEDNRHWIPLPDHPGDRFAYSGRFTAPEGLKVLSNGQGTQHEDGSWHYQMQHDLVAYLVMVAAGPYQVYEYPTDGVLTQQWVLPAYSEQSARNVGHRLPQMFEHMAQRTGMPYPWPVYREVYVERFLYSGMENTTATVMSSDRVLLPDDLAATRRWGENVVAHELAHQWFGDALTCDTWSELWLNEGFATFIAHDTLATLSWQPQHYAWSTHTWVQRSQSSGPLSDRGWSPGDHGRPSNNVYNHGAMVLQMLRVMLGEELFWAGIRRYVADNRMGLVETADLRAAMEEVSGMHLRWFFDQWVHERGAPKVSVRHRYDAQSGTLVVDMRQEAPKESPLRTLMVELEIPGRGIERLWLSEAQRTVRIPVDGRPKYVSVDPQGGLLADLDVTQNEFQWVAQLESPHPYAQLQAILALKDFGGPQTLVALEALVRDPKQSQRFRAQAIEALDTHPAALSLLQQFATDADPVLQQAAVAALGRRPEPQALGTLLGLSQLLPDVQATWIRAVAGHSPDKAVRLARGMVSGRPGAPARPQESAALQVLGEHGDDSDLRRILKRISLSSPESMLPSAMNAAASRVLDPDRPEGHQALSSSFTRAVVPLLGSDALRTRQRAIYGLQQAGDTQAIPALQVLARSSRVPGTADSCADAIEAIRARQQAPEIQDDNALRAQLQGLQEQLDALEETVQALQERY